MEPTHPDTQDQANTSNQPSAPQPEPHTIMPDRRVESADTVLTQSVDQQMATSATPGVTPEAPEVVTSNSMPAVAPAATVKPPEPVNSPAVPVSSTPPPVSAKRSIIKPLIIVAAAVVLLAAAAGVAYAAVIVPNKPANVLTAALENSLQAKQVSYKGSINLESDGNSSKVAISGSQDNTKHASDLNLEVTTTGVTVAVEGRLVDKNLYVKLGDLTSVNSLLSLYAGSEATKLTSVLNEQVANKWIVVDSTLLDQAGGSCALNANLSLTRADVNILEQQYKQYPFAIIQSNAGDVINGKNVTKYQLSIDDDKAAVYGDGLAHLSFVKALEACSKTAATSTTKSIGDHDKTPLTIWVDKATKQVVQIASQSTAQDANNGTKGSGQITFDYAPVSITAPSGAIPALQVLVKLEKALGLPTNGVNNTDFTGLLSGLGASAKLGQRH